MNCHNLIGNIGMEPELRQTPNGKSVCGFSLAVTEVKETEWFDIVAWGNTAEMVCKYLHKGSKIGITGRGQFREYTDKEGIKRRVYKVVADRITFVESKKDSGVDVQKADNFEDVEITSDSDLPF